MLSFVIFLTLSFFIQNDGKIYSGGDVKGEIFACSKNKIRHTFHGKDEEREKKKESFYIERKSFL